MNFSALKSNDADPGLLKLFLDQLNLLKIELTQKIPSTLNLI